MVFSLAPNSNSKSSPRIKNSTVSMMEIPTKVTKQFPRIFSAPSTSFCPIFIDARGAPPIPIRELKADIIMRMGNVTPTPVNAAAPISGMWPIYIRSTILYSIFTSCAVIAGTANRNRSLPTFPLPRSAVFCSCSFTDYAPHIPKIFHTRFDIPVRIPLRAKLKGLSSTPSIRRRNRTNCPYRS